MPKIFHDTGGGNVKLGEHIVGRLGNGERKNREGRKMWRGRSAA